MSLRIFDIVIGKQSQKYVPVKPQPQPEPQKEEITYDDLMNQLQNYIDDDTLTLGNINITGDDDRSLADILNQDYNGVTTIVYESSLEGTIPDPSGCDNITTLKLGFDLTSLLTSWNKTLDQLLNSCQNLDEIILTVQQAVIRNKFSYDINSHTIQVQLPQDGWQLVQNEDDSESYTFLAPSQNPTDNQQFSIYNRIESGSMINDIISFVQKELSQVRQIIKQDTLQNIINDYKQYVNLASLSLYNITIKNGDGELELPTYITGVGLRDWSRYDQNNQLIGADYLFKNNNDIVDITIAYDSGYNIQCNDAFQNCAMLQNVYLLSEYQNAVLYCGNAFSNCPNLESVTFSGRLLQTSFGEDVFQNCNMLELITYPESWKIFNDSEFPVPDSHDMIGIYIGGTYEAGEQDWSGVTFVEKQLYFFNGTSWVGLLPENRYAYLYTENNTIEIADH